MPTKDPRYQRVNIREQKKLYREAIPLWEDSLASPEHHNHFRESVEHLPEPEFTREEKEAALAYLGPPPHSPEIERVAVAVMERVSSPQFADSMDFHVIRLRAQLAIGQQRIIDRDVAGFALTHNMAAFRARWERHGDRHALGAAVNAYSLAAGVEIKSPSELPEDEEWLRFGVEQIGMATLPRDGSGKRESDSPEERKRKTRERTRESRRKDTEAERMIKKEINHHLNVRRLSRSESRNHRPILERTANDICHSHLRSDDPHRKNAARKILKDLKNRRFDPLPE